MIYYYLHHKPKEVLFFLGIVYSVEVPNYTWHLVLCLLDVLDLLLYLCVFALISGLHVGMCQCQVRLLHS